MKKLLVISVTIIIIAVAGAGVFAWLKFFGEKPVSCTQEAKLCSDGSYVGRTGPNCEFAACSGETKNNGIEGLVLLGPICPVMRNPPEPGCADKPYETSLVATTADGSRIIKQFASGADGKFTVDLMAGEYAIRSAAAANIRPYCNSNGVIKVITGQYTDATVYCDTGIR